MSASLVLVTGGAGFIGSELARQLVARGQQVRAVDNLANGRQGNLSDVLGQGCELIVTDIRDEAAMARALAGVKTVYHLACLGVRHSIHDPAENHSVNATATLQLLAAARRAGVDRFCYVSSSEVYGTARSAPMDEAHPTFPTTVYGASKLAGECYARAYHRSYGYPTLVVRPFNSFGPRCHHEGDSGEVIPKFMLRCLAGRPMVVFGDGLQTRDFTFVTDTARGILEAGVVDAAVGETLNLGSGREIAINDLAREVASVVGRPAVESVHESDRPGDVRRLCADTRLASRLIHFEARVDLHDGLARLLAWYRSLDRSPEALLHEETVRNWEGGAARG